MAGLGRGCVKTQNLKKYLGQHYNIDHLVYCSNLVIPQLPYIDNCLISLEIWDGATS
jgi:hypothetical protein